MSVAPVQVAGLHDPRLAAYLNVRDPELLRAGGLFVAEGRLVVERLLDRVPSGYRVKSLLLNEASFKALEPRLAELPDTPVYVCSTAELTSIIGFNLHRGCLALA